MDLERQIPPEYKSFFRIFSAQIPLPVGQFLDEKGGSPRQIPLRVGIDFRGCPVMPGHAPAIDVNDIRSEPGSTQLS